MDNFGLGLLLMVVGMITVYFILLLVIGLGKGLIMLVNKYSPEQVVAARPARNTTNAPGDHKALPDQTTAAIVSAVSVLTGGHGKVTKIEKQ
ncbi:MAG: OadG family protein [Tannerella sp.]|jgi:oxaloacetate decarboxylase gamma subunit|nr:OadG family protein [Tannerella sp.]